MSKLKILLKAFVYATIFMAILVIPILYLAKVVNKLIIIILIYQGWIPYLISWIIFYLIVSSTNKKTPIVIILAITFVGALGFIVWDIMYYCDKRDTPPTDASSYYYFVNDSEDNYMTSEIYYNNTTKNTNDKIELKNSILEKISHIHKDDLYINANNELIVKNLDGSLYYKYDTYGNKIDSTSFEYTSDKVFEGDDLWKKNYSNEFNTWVLKDKIIDPNAKTYCNWLETSNKTIYKMNIIERDTTFSQRDDTEFYEKHIECCPLIIFEGNKEKYSKIIYEANEKINCVNLKINLFHLDTGVAYSSENGAKVHLISSKLYKRDIDKQEIVGKDNLPFNSFYSIRYNDREYNKGILYSNINLGKDTLKMCLYKASIDKGVFKSDYYHYKDSIKETETFSDITLYKNKHLNYKLLIVNDYFFIVKDK